MGKIVVTEFISLDGVIENPAWTVPYWNDEIAKIKGAEMETAEAQLLGRITYEGFAKAWPESKDEGAERFNAMLKYVATTTLTELTWNNSHRIEGDLAQGVRDLKAKLSGDILVYGSGTLVQSLIKHDLVDEYTLVTYPVVLGKGQRLFADGSALKLELIEARPCGKGVVLLRYAPVRG